MNCDDAIGSMMKGKKFQFGILDVCLWWLGVLEVVM